MGFVAGDLVILVRSRDSADERYPNQWVGSRLDVLATHQMVVNAIKKAVAVGRRRVFVQISPGGRVVGSATIGRIDGRGDVCSVVFTEWRALDEAAPGRSYGTSFYWVP